MLFLQRCEWIDILPFAIWHIWITRNNDVHKQTTSFPSAALVKDRVTKFILLTDRENHTENRLSVHIKWLKPPSGVFKLNMVTSLGSHYGIGEVIRNTDGVWVVGFSANSLAINVALSELLALHQGLQIAHERYLTPIEIEIDSTDLFSILDKVPPLFNSIVWSCRRLLKKLGNPVLRHNFREANGVTDFLSKKSAKMRQTSVDLLLSPPYQVLPGLQHDLQETTVTKLVTRSVCNNFSRKLIY